MRAIAEHGRLTSALGPARVRIRWGERRFFFITVSRFIERLLYDLIGFSEKLMRGSFIWHSGVRFYHGGVKREMRSFYKAMTDTQGKYPVEEPLEMVFAQALAEDGEAGMIGYLFIEIYAAEVAVEDINLNLFDQIAFRRYITEEHEE
jgi:hypothetical protein